jgi:hypothetical protein
MSKNMFYLGIIRLTLFSTYTEIFGPSDGDLTNSMELRPSWEAVSCAATQEFPDILSDPKVH